MSRPDSSDASAKEARKAIDVAAVTSKILANIEKVILGKRQQITTALAPHLRTRNSARRSERVTRAGRSFPKPRRDHEGLGGGIAADS